MVFKFTNKAHSWDDRPGMIDVYANDIVIEPMTIADYDEAMTLWTSVDGVCIDECDSAANIARFLERNPRLSVVGRHKGSVVAAALCGHDGLIGYIYHLAVAPACRGRGLGRAIVAHALAGLRAEGIQRCDIVVSGANQGALSFWQSLGFAERDGRRVLDKDLPHIARRFSLSESSSCVLR